jgi:hypothetical protein
MLSERRCMSVSEKKRLTEMVSCAG